MKYEIRSTTQTVLEKRLLIEDRNKDTLFITFISIDRETKKPSELKLGTYSKEELKRLARSL